MEAASPTQENCQAVRSLSPKQNTFEQEHAHGSENVQGQHVETRIVGPDFVEVGLLVTPLKDAAENPSRSARKENRVSSTSVKRKYMLRSSVGSARVLRSRLRGTCKPPDPSSNSVNVSAKREKKRKNRKKIKRTINDEFSKTRKRLRYILTRMGYERNLIDAYSGEGWKGQSIEKIKPEKELQRATSEILRCKLRIRDLFQHLDSLCAEGRLQESFFDSEGQINSEDIFCAKCGSKDLSADNDIILCDGICDRGFHQMCLEPPLLKEEIPPGDEGWLCPGCDCKVDCIDLLNDSQGTDLSIGDNWEKVFPEVAAGDKPDDNFGFPSDDSEDDDYDPDGPQVDERVQKEGSSSEESDFTSASDDSGASSHDEQYLGLPSDDSEDDDYDPNAPDLDEQLKKETSSSDFTSDSEDSNALSDGKPSSRDEDPVSSSADGAKPLTGSGERGSTMTRKKKQSVNSEVLSILEAGPSQRNASPVSGKRSRERLDYKKLHDEAYGNVPSDSSDDEDWTDTDATRKRKNEGVGNESVISPNGNSAAIKSGTSTRDAHRNLKHTENTPQRRTRQKLDFAGANSSAAETHKDSPEPDKKATASPSGTLGKARTQRLLESLRENKYPARDTKKNLAEELGITVRQVSKWFENARRSLRQANIRASRVGIASPNKDTILTRTNGKVLEPEPKNLANDGASNGVESKELAKAGTVEMPCCSMDVERRCMTGEPSPQKSMSPKLRNRGNDMIDHRTSNKALGTKETDSPGAQAARRNGQNTNQEVTRLQVRTRSRKAVA